MQIVLSKYYSLFVCNLITVFTYYIFSKICVKVCVKVAESLQLSHVLGILAIFPLVNQGIYMSFLNMPNTTILHGNLIINDAFELVKSITFRFYRKYYKYFSPTSHRYLVLFPRPPWKKDFSPKALTFLESLDFSCDYYKVIGKPRYASPQVVSSVKWNYWCGLTLKKFRHCLLE